MLKNRTSKALVTPLRRVTRRDWWLGVFRQSNTGWSASSIDKSWIHESLFTVCGTAANKCGALSEPKQHCPLRTHPFLLWAKTQMIVAMWILWPTTRMTRIYLRSHLIMRTKPSPRNCGYNLVVVVVKRILEDKHTWAISRSIYSKVLQGKICSKGQATT